MTSVAIGAWLVSALAPSSLPPNSGPQACNLVNSNPGAAVSHTLSSGPLDSPIRAGGKGHRFTRTQAASVSPAVDSGTSEQEAPP
jgi:hypothetical protein